MARKVFISFLGTNNYVKCFYQFGDKQSRPVRFVQEAIIANLCKDWCEEDRIFIFYTSSEKSGEKGSKEFNWLDNGHEKVYEDEEKIGLKHRLDELKTNINLKPVVEDEEIATGYTENEIWSIFDTVYNKLQTGDRIYFDVTHAFRSIPLFSIVLFNHAKFMISTKLESIMYGAFEKLGPAFIVRQIPLENRIAPIVDLTDIARLQEYNQLASGLRLFGRVRELGEFVNSEEDNKIGRRLQNLSSAITELDEHINTINLNEIKQGKYIIRFRDNLRKGINHVPIPIRNILKELDDATHDFVSKESFKNIEAAIDWTIKHEMLMQAYPLAEEYVCLFLNEKYKEKRPSQLKGKKYREFFADLLGMPNEAFNNKEWKCSLEPHPELCNFLSNEQIILKLRPHYGKIRDSRNSLAHGNGSFTYQQLKDNIPSIKKCFSILNSDDLSLVNGNGFSIFLNLSNHPSSQWEENQIEAAKEYGEIEDMPFPAILPDATENETQEIAKDYLDKILEKAGNANITVHIMGEMTFTYALVSLLKAEGITCLASTTNRIAEEQGSKKTSEFHFVRFREY